MVTEESDMAAVSPATYFIRTFGCQMNVADSLIYARVLESLGFIKSESEEDADVLVINTCSVRNKAEEKAISYVGSVSKKRAGHRAEMRNQNRGGIVFVGCMATVRGDEMLSRFRDVKAIVPAKELGTFEDRIISTFPDLARKQVDVKELPLLRPEEKYERFVPIVRGCINRCTYCIVPLARGGTISSRNPSEIFREVGSLIESGVKSITFLGQNVCSYGTESPRGWDKFPEDYGIVHLLSDIRDRFGETGAWFKFLTSHPRDVDEKLIEVVAGHESFSKHFHLPLQAGDDGILKRMARGYSSGKYLELIEMIRTRIPDARITTDLIVGFPGEDEKAFEKTLEMVKVIRFDAAFTFLYSPRAETPAEKWADPVPIEIKKRRLQELIQVQNRITIEKATLKVGEERNVLVNGPATRKPGRGDNMVAGRTREEEVVVLKGNENDYGNIVRVRLVDAKQRSFKGERIDNETG